MPPMRSLPTPLIRPLKTERSHEENQERAYIAASRRSDRSLEARVESARRASEIHKRRTGRSLRVTEQDVINEEMYEEEDDDLPLQYRRLTAHLQTGSPDFNRRLHAYIQNQVAMRTALSQAVANQRFAASHGLNPQAAFPQMWQSMDGPAQQQGQQSQQPQQQQQYPGGMGSPITTYSPSFHPYAHHRSTSFAVSNTSGPNTPVVGPKSDARRSSEPVKSIEDSAIEDESTGAKSDTSAKKAKIEPKEVGDSTNNFQPYSPTSHTGFSPLTTSIPLETQTFFQHPSFNMNQLNMPPFNMNSNDMYNFNEQTEQLKPGNMQPRFSGMSQTLAPSMLDTKSGSFTPQPFSPSGNTNDLDSATLSSTYDTFDFDNQFNTDEYGFQSGEANNDNEFADLLDSSAFVDSGDEQTAS